MTGFFHLDQRRAHAVPRNDWPETGGTTSARPRLVAEWHRMPGGDLVCRWRTERRAETEPPG